MTPQQFRIIRGTIALLGAITLVLGQWYYKALADWLYAEVHYRKNP